MICPVNEKGIFTDEVVDFKGLYVKDADKQIIKMLKEKGLLLKQEQYKHSLFEFSSKFKKNFFKVIHFVIDHIHL